MAGFQLLGILTTVMLSFLFGMFTGWLITNFHNIDSKDFYMDNLYFELPQDAKEKFIKKGTHLKKKQTFMDNKFL